MEIEKIEKEEVKNQNLEEKSNVNKKNDNKESPKMILEEDSVKNKIIEIIDIKKDKMELEENKEEGKKIENPNKKDSVIIVEKDEDNKKNVKGVEVLEVEKKEVQKIEILELPKKIETILVKEKMQIENKEEKEEEVKIIEKGEEVKIIEKEEEVKIIEKGEEVKIIEKEEEVKIIEKEEEVKIIEKGEEVKIIKKEEEVKIIEKEEEVKIIEKGEEVKIIEKEEKVTEEKMIEKKSELEKKMIIEEENVIEEKGPEKKVIEEEEKVIKKKDSEKKMIIEKEKVPEKMIIEEEKKSVKKVKEKKSKKKVTKKKADQKKMIIEEEKGKKSKSKSKTKNSFINIKKVLIKYSKPANLEDLNILLLGITPIGLEISKNLMLSKINSLTIWDNKKNKITDKEYNFFLEEKNFENKNKCLNIKKKLEDLNPYKKFEILEKENIDDIINKELLENFDLVVICDFYKLEKIDLLNKKLKDLNKGLVVCNTAGLFGFSFSDFSNKNNIYNSKIKFDKYKVISISKNGILEVKNKKNDFDIKKGDYIKIKGTTKKFIDGVFKVKNVIGNKTLQISIKNEEDTVFKKKVVIKKIFLKEKKQCESFKDFLLNKNYKKENLFVEENDFRLKTVLRVFWNYIENKGMPDFYNFQELTLFKQILKSELEIDLKKLEITNIENYINFLNENTLKLFFSLAKGNFAPISSFFGGLATINILNFLETKEKKNFHINEFYTNIFKDYNFEDFVKNRDDIKKNINNISQIALLGNEVQKKIQNANILLIGSDILSSEYIKMLSKMGFSEEEGSNLMLSDNDLIQNFICQPKFLQNQNKKGTSKASNLSKKALQFNKSIKLKVFKQKVCYDNENIFTDEIWDKLDFVINTSNDLETKSYLKAKSVFHLKTYYDSFVQENECETQILKPLENSFKKKIKSKAISNDKFFPYKMEHCVKWSINIFKEIFETNSLLFTNYFKNPEKTQKFIKSLSEKYLLNRFKLRDLNNFVKIFENPYLDSYIKFAIKIYQRYFDQEISELLILFPPDLKDEKCIFWNSPNRPPITLPFKKSNVNHQNFIIVFVKILNQIFPLQETANKEKILECLKKIKVSRKKILMKNRDEKKLKIENEEKLSIIFEKLKEINRKYKRVYIKNLNLDLKNEKTSHLDLVTLLSNIKAYNYSINMMSKKQIKNIIGYIQPSFNPLNSIVCGMNGIELYKQFLKTKSDKIQKIYFNNSKSQIEFSSLKQKNLKNNFYDYKNNLIEKIPKNFNMWSKIEINGPLKLEELFLKIKESHGILVNCIVTGNIQLWTKYSKRDDFRLKMKIEDILENFGIQKYKGKKYQVFVISGENEKHDYIECPIIKYVLG